MSILAMHRTRVAAATLLGTIVVAFGAALPAAAHSEIVDSTPGEGATLVELPASFSVTANEDLLDAAGTTEGFLLQIVDADGTHYENGVVAIDGATLSTNAAAGDPGEYTLVYRVVSEDGHPIEGAIAWTWAPTAQPAPPDLDPPYTPVPMPTVTPIETPEPEMTTYAEPGEGEAGGDASWLGGAVSGALLLVGGLAAALAPRRR